MIGSGTRFDWLSAIVVCGLVALGPGASISRCQEPPSGVPLRGETLRDAQVEDDRLRSIALRIVALDAERSELLASLSARQLGRLDELLAELTEMQVGVGMLETVVEATAENDGEASSAVADVTDSEASTWVPIESAPETVAARLPESVTPSAPITAPAPAPAPGTELVPTESRGVRGARCPAWTAFDSNGDGELSGADRYFRHFFVWLDNGDGQVSESEMVDPFRLGLRSMSLDLRSYNGAKETVGVVERRLNNGQEVLRVEILRKAKGAKGADYGVLAIDVGAVVRGFGPEIRRSGGPVLETGLVIVDARVEVRADATSEWSPLLCGRRAL